MIRESNVDVVEPAVAHEIGPADQLLLGGRAEHLEGALEAEAVDRGLGGERGGDQHRTVGVMAFAMARRAVDDGFLLGEPGDLRIVRIGIVFGMDCDHRFAAAAGRAETADKA
jgi:hypothetical protein